MDVKTAFLNGILKEEVYVGQPPGFVSKQYPDHVYALDKALYGLKQAPRAWYDVLSKFLVDSGFQKGSIDTTLFIKKKGGTLCVGRPRSRIAWSNFTLNLIVAVRAVRAQVLWMRTQLTDYGFSSTKVRFTCVSKSAIAISCNPVQHTRTKHIDVRAVVRLPDPKLKTLGERGIECIFIGYAEHSKAFRFYVIEPNDSVSINTIIELRDAIFNENRFSSVPRPSLMKPNGTEDIGGSVVPKEVDGTIEKFKGRLVIQDFKQKSRIDYFDTYAPVAPKQWHQKFDEVVLSNGYLLNQADKCVYSKFDESGKGVIICLYVDDMLIFGIDQVLVHPSRFSIKDMGEADVILGIRIKHESNGIAISQSHYIEKVLKKFNHFDCTLVSTPIDTSEKLMPNNGQAISQLEKTEQASKKQTCITGLIKESEFVALKAASKEAKWLKNFLLEISLWVKPIAPISIRCDSAATLTKAYSQMYNGKSRHLGVRHSMICELITNRVVSIEFVRSQQNLADHLTNGLARDLVTKSAEGM
ncbi:zinc finger, CCHC-type containing protein [Tanacetum coccineum]